MSNNDRDKVWTSRMTQGNVKETHVGIAPYVVTRLERIRISGWNELGALEEMESTLKEILEDVQHAMQGAAGE